MRRFRDFEEFIDWVGVRTDMEEPLQRKPRHKLTSAQFLMDDDCAVDFVGRFEHLEEDLGQIAARIGVQIEVPHVNRGPGSDYRSWYSNRSRKIVERVCAEEIEKFGYRFD